MSATRGDQCVCADAETAGDVIGRFVGPSTIKMRLGRPRTSRAPVKTLRTTARLIALPEGTTKTACSIVPF